MNHAAARTPKVVAPTLLDHGEIETSPIPAPRVSSASANAEATSAPAMIADQDTAESSSADSASVESVNATARASNMESVIAVSPYLAERFTNSLAIHRSVAQ